MERITNKTYSSRGQRTSSETIYYIAQKIVGIFLFIGGIVVGIVIQEFAAFFFGLIVGLPLIFTKEKELMIGKVYWDENPIEKR